MWSIISTVVDVRRGRCVVTIIAGCCVVGWLLLCFSRCKGLDVEWGNRRGIRLLLLLERRVEVTAGVVIVRGLGLLGAVIDGFCVINWGLG